MQLLQYSDKQKRTILATTEQLMTEANILIRDTWYGYDNVNLDDYKAYGGKWNEAKLFSIVITAIGKPNSTHQDIYPVPFHECIAYDRLQISIPVSHLKFTSTIAHECVHFLQYQTEQTSSTYVEATGNGYDEYLSQRCELEAHFVQLMYIVKHEIGDYDIDLQVELHNVLDDAIADPSKRHKAILKAREHKLI